MISKKTIKRVNTIREREKKIKEETEFMYNHEICPYCSKKVKRKPTFYSRNKTKYICENCGLIRIYEEEPFY